MSSSYSVWNMDVCLGWSNSLCSCFGSGCLLVGSVLEQDFSPCALGSLYFCFLLSSPPSCLALDHPAPLIASLWCFVSMMNYFPPLFYSPYQSSSDWEIVDMPLLSTTSCWRIIQLRHIPSPQPPPSTHRGWGREGDGRMTNCSAVSLCFVWGFVPSRFVCSLWASGRTHLPGHCTLYEPLKLLIKHSQKVSCLADTHTEAKTDEWTCWGNGKIQWEEKQVIT